MIWKTKRIIHILISVVALSFFVLPIQLPVHVLGDDVTEDIEIDKHYIYLQQKENIWVEEQIVFNYTVFHHTPGGPTVLRPKWFNGILYLWVPRGRENLLILSNNVAIRYTNEDATMVSVDLEENNLKIQQNKQLQLNITYSLDLSFLKKITYTTHNIKVEIKSEKYPQASIPLTYNATTDVYVSSISKKNANFSFEINFISIRCSQFNIYFYFLLAIIVFLTLIIAYVFLPKKISFAKEPDESLNLRKKLVMESLKNLEKERGKGNIPDTYYQSIKNEYKEEAVKLMEELEKREKNSGAWI